MTFSHMPVMPDECIEALLIKPEGTYVDATVGGGGHSALIAEKLSKEGTLIGIDRDAEALEAAKERLEKYGCVKKLVHCDYSEIKKALEGKTADGILADLGVSSYQIDNPERGFSYRFDSPLDMRMDKGKDFSAYDVVNGYSKEELTRVIREYGEEKYAYEIACNIVKKRETAPIKTTGELTARIDSSMPAKMRYNGSHSAKKTFQAIRIEVNDELGILNNSLSEFFDCLKSGGRLAVITFHSLEDRIVKNFFKEKARGCTCPPEFPVCVCGKKPEGMLITKKPITAGEDELAANSRSQSAKLRVIERI